jgi:hypothetical protein
MIVPAPICLLCTRLRWEKETTICAAFPKGIPERIYLFAFDHRRPFRGDGGIRFELAAGKEESLSRWKEHWGERSKGARNA